MPSRRGEYLVKERIVNTAKARCARPMNRPERDLEPMAPLRARLEGTTAMSLSEPTPDTASSPGARRGPIVTAEDILAVQRHMDLACVSLFLNTEPGHPLDAKGMARLGGLHREALGRLRSDAAGPHADVVRHLDQMVAKARLPRSGRAVALFANSFHAQIIDLPITVPERVVIDVNFATRDLVRALHRTPRHAVLVLSAKEAKLYEGQAGTLRPVVGSRFPLAATDQQRRETSEPFLHIVDSALGAYLRLHPTPLVLAGAEPTVSRFRALSRNVSRLAAVVKGNHLRTPLDRLALLVSPHLEVYLRSREKEALALLEVRRGDNRAHLGVDAAWLVARWGRPEMLAVEHDFFYPARISADGDMLEPVSDLGAADVVDDIVDEIIEIILLRGGWVALLESGAIPAGARIAVTERR